ncbi:hypothetical protein MMC10_003594 [Thelotrema lepadinum]|nr:hypothetical protein [Thelotrema lepadinum]
MTDSGQSVNEGLLTRALHMAGQTDNQRHEPRHPKAAFGLDQAREIGDFLRNEKPPSPEKGESEEDWSSKRSSGPSRNGSRHAKASEFFKTSHFSARHFRNFLRSRSISPPRARQLQNIENTYVVEKISLVRQQGPGGSNQYTRILRDSSQTDSLDKLSTYRVNYVVDSHGPESGEHPNSEEAITKNVNPARDQSQRSCTPDTAGPCHALSADLQGSKSGHNFGNEVSRKTSLNPVKETTRTSQTFPRQMTAPQIRDFAEGGPRFPDPELLAAIERKKRRSRMREDWIEVDRSGYAGGEVASTGPANNKKLPCTPPVADKCAEQAQQHHPQIVMRVPSTLSSATQSGDNNSTGRPSKDSTNRSVSVSDNADAATDITIPSSNGTPKEPNRFRRTASPKPAPTGPLPPLPEGADATTKPAGLVLQGKSLRDRPSRSNTSLHVVPPKSPARIRQPPCSPLGTGQSQKKGTTLGSDLKWPYPPVSQFGSNSAAEPKVCPGIQEADPEDPFLLRMQKTKDLKRRDLEQNKSAVSNDCNNAGIQSTTATLGHEDSEDIVILPNNHQSTKISASDSATKELPQKEQLDPGSYLQHGGAVLGFSPVETIFEIEPIEPVIPVRPKSLTMRTTYRSHSTQYSPTRDRGTQSSMVYKTASQRPSLVVTEHTLIDSPNQQEGASPQDTAHQSTRFSGSLSQSSLGSGRGGLRPTTPENSVDINDMETRMEARLASVERKNMLLEAALLGVMNASARSSLGGSRTTRSSGGSRNVNSLLWETPLDVNMEVRKSSEE